MKLTKFFTLCLSFLLMITIATIGLGGFAEATSNRSATIDEVVGTVWVQKAGGHLTLRAYAGMSLEQGDRLTTSGEYSSAKVVFPDTKDKITIEKNAEIRLTDLRTEAGHSITRVTVWSGQVFSSVTPITNEQDVFEIRSPDQTARAKGTNFFVGVDPMTGESRMTVFSGIVQGSQTNPTSNQGSDPIYIYPGQQLVLPPDSSADQLEDFLSILDVSDMANQLTPAMIEELVRAKARIDRENAELLKRLEDGNVPPSSDHEYLADLDRFATNSERLIASILQEAVNQNIIDEQAMRQMIAELNSDVNLNTPVELDHTAAEKARLDKLNRIREERQRQAQQEKEKQEALQRQNEELMKKLQAQRDQLAAQQQKKLEEQRQEAEKRYKEQLNAAQAAAFEAAQRKKEEDRRAQEAAAEEMKKKAEPAPQPSRPSPLNPDRELENAINSIPADYYQFYFYYTEDSFNALHEALELSQETDAEKLVKAKAIRDAIAGLVEIDVKDIQLIHADIESNQIFAIWKEYPNTEDYVYFLNGYPIEIELNEEIEIGSDDLLKSGVISFGPDYLASNEIHTLKIIAVGEGGQALAQKVIKFSLAPTTINNFDSALDGNSLYLSWAKIDEVIRYEVELNDEKVFPSEDSSDSEEIRYEFQYIERDHLYKIEIKAFNASNEVVASKTLITDFSSY